MEQTKRWSPAWDDVHVRLTPRMILDPVRAAMGGTIGLDPCTEPDNPTRAREYHALPDDGLGHRWVGRGPVWVNPPWGDTKPRWVARAIESGQAGERVALLIPAYTETAATQAVIAGADQVILLLGYVPFATRSSDGVESRHIGWGKGLVLALWGIDAPEGLGVIVSPLRARSLLS